MYSGVPSIWTNPVYTVCSVSNWPIALATPKSITFTTPIPSCTCSANVGEGLRSRWMIPCPGGVLHGRAQVCEELSRSLQQLAG